MADGPASELGQPASESGRPDPVPDGPASDGPISELGCPTSGCPTSDAIGLSPPALDAPADRSPKPDIDFTAAALQRAGFVSPDDRWLLFCLAIEGPYPDEPLPQLLELIATGVLNRIVPQVLLDDSDIGAMLFFMFPKLCVRPLLTEKGPGVRERATHYPRPQITALLALAATLGGPDGLRRRTQQWMHELENSIVEQAADVPEAVEPAAEPEDALSEASDSDEPPTSLPPDGEEYVSDSEDSADDVAVTPAPAPAPAAPAPVIRGRPTGHRLPAPLLAAAAHRRVSRGQLRQAARVILDDSPPVAVNAEVLARLRELHPFVWSERSFPLRGNAPANTDYRAQLRASADKMALDTASGPSGWSVGLMRIALRSDAVRAGLAAFLQGMLRDEARGQRYCCASRLVVLSKPGGGVRPIAVGEVPYRLFMSAVLTNAGSAIRGGLLPTQFGVRNPGGVEPIVRMVEHAVAGDVPCAQITCLDFSNAYNTLSRDVIAATVRDQYPQLYRLARWAYRGPAALFVDGRTPDGQYRAVELESREGVRQGDPLAPLLFSVGMRPFLECLQDALGPGHLVLAYLDDVMVLSEREADVVAAADRAAHESATGLRLNVAKSRVYSLDRVREAGLDILGTRIGSVEARSEFADHVIASLNLQVGRLLRSQLPLQDKWLLLSQSVQQKFRHLMRQLDSEGIEELWIELDNILMKAVAELGQIPLDDMDALARTLASLPERHGGLGILSHSDCFRAARRAMQESADFQLRQLGLYAAGGPTADDRAGDAAPARQGDLCEQIFRQRFEETVDKLPHDAAVALLEHREPLSRRFLRSTPFNCSVVLDNRTMAGAIRIRLLRVSGVYRETREGLPTTVCVGCGATGCTAVHGDACPAIPHRRRHGMHTQIQNLITGHLKSVPGSRVTREVWVPTDRRIDDHRLDIRVSGPVAMHGTTAGYDISVVSGRARQSSERQEDGESRVTWAKRTIAYRLHAREQAKFAKYAMVPGFAPLVLSISGTMGPAFAAQWDHWVSVYPKMHILARQLSVLLIRERVARYGF